MAARKNDTMDSGSELVIEKESLDPDDKLVCACREVALGDMRAMLSQEPNMSFDSFLASSTAGSKCTACLLDLEYYFVHLPRSGAGKTISKKSADRSPEPLRRRLYRWIDKLSPMRPLQLKNHVPVLRGPGVEEWIWLANYEMLDGKGKKVPDFDVTLRLYDASGRLVHDQHVALPVDSEFRGQMSEFLPQPGSGPASGDHAELSVGWLEVTRRAKADGVRGTTRPQIEIVTSKSACAVHGQSAGFGTGNEFDMICNPEDDRVFVSLVNPSDVPIDFTMTYPMDPLMALEVSPRSIPVKVPPRGARLHEVALTPEERRAFASRLFKFAWRGTGYFKAHVIVASKSLDRFSIDHV